MDDSCTYNINLSTKTVVNINCNISEETKEILKSDHSKQLILAEFNSAVNKNTITINTNNYDEIIKKILLHNMKYHVYTRLKPDQYGGVGVFAIRKIPKDTFLFETTFGHCKKEDIVEISYGDIKKSMGNTSVATKIIKTLEAFYVGDDLTKTSNVRVTRYRKLKDLKKKVFTIPTPGHNSINVEYYLNHGIKPRGMNDSFQVINESKYTASILEESCKRKSIYANIKIHEVEGCGMCVYKTARDVEEGMELLIDYYDFLQLRPEADFSSLFDTNSLDDIARILDRSKHELYGLACAKTKAKKNKMTKR